MRTLGLIMTILFCYAAVVLLVAWPDLRELYIARNWRVTETDGPAGELQGIHVNVDQARAMVLPTTQDRAIVYARLSLQGDPVRMREWLGCDIGLTDESGHKWLPLFNPVGQQIAQMLGDKDRNQLSCGQALTMVEDADTPVFSDQAFLVPVDKLQELRFQISGMRTRPYAISLTFKPVLQVPPPG